MFHFQPYRPDLSCEQWIVVASDGRHLAVDKSGALVMKVGMSNADALSRAAPDRCYMSRDSEVKASGVVHCVAVGLRVNDLPAYRFWPSLGRLL